MCEQIRRVLATGIALACLGGAVPASATPVPATAPPGVPVGAPVGVEGTTGGSQAPGTGLLAGPGMLRTFGSGASLGWHLLRSHSRDLLLQPVRSVKNLFVYGFGLGSGFIRDASLEVASAAQRRRPAPPLSDQGGMDLNAWERSLDRLTGTRRTSGTMELLVDGGAFYPRLEQEIRRASRSIVFRTYIFDNDDVALNIADLLKTRSKDISVDVLMDGIGSWGGAQATAVSQPAHHMGPTSIARYLREDSNVQAGVLGNTWLMGDHTKTFLFDDRIAFVGGMNIGREYRFDWHDLMLELRGPVVAQLSADARRAVQRNDWGDFAFLAGAEAPVDARRTVERSEADDSELRLLYTRPGDPQIYRAQLAAIRRARRHIFIENAYLADDRLLYELIRARHRGVDVRVIFPHRSDSAAMNRSNTLAINQLIDGGVRVYLYPGMSHVKAAVYDGWACLGTANLDRLSLKVNREVNVATSEPELVEAVIESLFLRDFENSVELKVPKPVGVADHVYERIVDAVL